jgi:hypothetical protein
VIFVAEKKRSTVVERKHSVDVARLIAAFDRAPAGERADFEEPLISAIEKALREGRTGDAIALKQRLLILRQAR